jgi:CubicO group peptidase (beta-lactamase class C family)
MTRPASGGLLLQEQKGEDGMGNVRTGFCTAVPTCLLVIPGLAVGSEPLPSGVLSVIEAPRHKQSHWGILVADLEPGETVYELNANRLFGPASTTKLFSTAAALDALGADYRFTTPIYRRGSVGAVRGVRAGQAKGSGYGLGVTTFDGWLGHSGGVTGAMCNVYIHPKADTVIIQHFNKLDPLDEKQNAADLKALGDALLETMRIVAPGTLPK